MGIADKNPAVPRVTKLATITLFLCKLFSGLCPELPPKVQGAEHGPPFPTLYAFEE